MKVHSPLYCITVDCAVLCQSTIPVFHFTLFIMMFLRSQTTSVFALWSFDSLTHQFFKFVDLFPILPKSHELHEVVVVVQVTTLGLQ